MAKLIDKGRRRRPGMWLLHQTERWIWNENFDKRIDQMSADEVARVLSWLDEHAIKLLELEQEDWLSMPEPGGEMAADDFWKAFDEVMDEGPRSFVLDLPVWQALETRLREIQSHTRTMPDSIADSHDQEAPCPPTPPTT